MPYKEGGKWRAGVMVKGLRGPTKLFDTKKEALAYEAAERKRLKKLAKKSQSGLDLLTFCSRYIVYSERYSQKTYQEKKAVCEKLIRYFGSDRLVESIQSAEIESFLNLQKEQRSANAANKDRKNLLAMWNHGIKMWDIQSNPIGRIKPFPHDRSPQYTPPTKDVLKIMAAASRSEYVLLICYLNTAARRSEIFRWTWADDINFERRQYRLGTRKTRDGSMEYDWFPMSQELYDELWWWYNNRPLKDSPYVFTDNHPGPNYGKPFKVRRKFMKGLCKRAGVKEFGFHALRRYVASVLADTHKVSSKQIQRILRHKALRTTERYIQHINEDLKSTFELLSVKNLHEDVTRNGKEATDDVP
jgi:integrase